MTKFVHLVLAFVAAMTLSDAAHATIVNYNLSLTGGTLSGTGNLQITNGPAIGSGLVNIPIGDVTALTVSIDGITFNLLSDVSALQFTGAALSDITAAASISPASISVNGITSIFFDNTIPSVLSDDTVTATLAAAVPEPSTWAMMMLGFVGLGMMAYRRKLKTALTMGGSSLALPAYLMLPLPHRVPLNCTTRLGSTDKRSEKKGELTTCRAHRAN